MKKIKFLSILLIAVTIFIMSGCNDKVDDNIDNVKPTIVINNPTTAEVGIIKIDYVVTDNVTPTDKLKVNIICVKDGMMIEVVGNEFNASETGIYSIQVSATDEANNKGSASLDITVIKNEQTPTGDTIKPVLFVDIPSEAYVGEEVVIDYQVSDNACFSSEILVSIVVKTSDEEIELHDNKFVVVAGECEIFVTATDTSGNSTTITHKILGKADDLAPVIEISDLSGIAVGDEVTLDYTITDNVTSSDILIPEITLERNEKVRHISGKSFDVIDDGEYKLTLTVTDEAGNTATKVVRFNVNYVRENRNMDTTPVSPENKVTLDSFVDVDENKLVADGKNYIMKSEKYNIVFVRSDSGYYVDFVYSTNNEVMFTMPAPIVLYFKSVKQLTGLYSSIEFTRYGVLASGTNTTPNGSVLTVNDHYYYPDNDDVTEAINIQREIEVINYSADDIGYQSVFAILTVDNNPDNIDWFIPSNIFGAFDTANQSYRVYRETLCGLPMVMFRDKTTGYSISLSRYKPVIDYSTTSYACVGAYCGENTVNSNASSIEINYPSRDSARKYFDIESCHRVVYDMTIMADQTETFADAYIDMYCNQYLLEDVRIVNTDIEECYKVINEDFKSFTVSKKNKGYTSYGVEVPITIENGIFHGCSWQAGFTGQQLAAAYNMMFYGLKYNDTKSFENGYNIINFWVNDIHMMSDSGVPWTWFEGYYMEWLGYPAFLRMVIDAMEGLFDAYRLAEANGIETGGWIETVLSCADWLVRCQNTDGSWYRCYNYEGTIYRGDEPDITYDPGIVAKPSSKNSTPMPVRFLGKMYEYTNDEKYLNSIKKAGEYIYTVLYPQNVYIGGTCDNADCVDKEAGVFAMYAYDTLYTLTGEERWLECLEQATIFTMSTVITVSFKVKTTSKLKVAYALQCGYSDGLSYIVCGGTAVDNYVAYIYYQLFRLYIHTGKEVYYKMSEFIQQNTKSTMDWDGVLRYPYKSLIAEASTIYTFSYSAAKDQYGTQGIWLPWQSVANGEPVTKMIDTFNVCDVKALKDVPIIELRKVLDNYGVGGNEHRKFS